MNFDIGYKFHININIGSTQKLKANVSMHNTI